MDLDVEEMRVWLELSRSFEPKNIEKTTSDPKINPDPLDLG